jgi:lipid-binding SYLF domain-containing protein/peptidoglycan hydrolase-like protein with peptidoglycan-binding domain
MSVNKLGMILFSSFLVFATAPVAPAQSPQNETKKQQSTQKGSAAKDNSTATSSSSSQSSKTTEKKSQQTEKKATADKNEKNAGSDNKAGTEKKAGAKKGAAKKSSSISKDKVRDVQQALKKEGFDPGPVDGIMGPMTMTALRNFQSHNQLAVTGTLDRETENALMHGATAQRSSNDQYQQSTTSTTNTTSEYSNTEAAATSVDDVKQIQESLAGLGYNPGDVNGMMTSDTQQAIREFQWLNSLPVTGIVDQRTKIALDTQSRGGFENAQLGQSTLSVEREKPTGNVSSESEQNRADTTATQERSDTYSKDTQGKDTKHTDHAATTKTDKDGADRISKAAAVLQDLTASADKKVPNGLLERAEAIAVIPHMIKGAFGIGGRYGKGVVSERAENGRWSPPAFIEIGGGSFGLQLGGTATDLVLVFTDRKALDMLSGGKDLKLGVDAGVVAGPLGREAEAGVNANLKTAIYAYSRAKGLFAGVALDGAVLSMDKDMNHKVYGESVDGKQILNGNVAANATVRPFTDTVERVVPKKRISQK